MACHAAAQRVTRSYRHAPLSQVLTDLDNASERYTVNFIYNELEDFTVTTDFRNRTIPEAVRDVLGFYPMQLTVGDSLIFVECSQKEPWKVIGRVVDSAGRAVSLANVALLSPADSAFVNGGVTNDGGDFVIPCTRRQVLLRVSYVGFKTLYRAVSTGHVGTLRLTPDSYMLRNVDVKAVRKVVKSEVDRLQYLVGNDPYAVGMNALELMRRVPMLNVVDETVSIVGKSTTRFMLDGHVLDMGDEAVKAKLRSLKAEEIDRVEVMTIPPAKYKAEANGGYVNIVTRKGQTRGWSGSLTMEPQAQYRLRLLPEASVSYVSSKFEMSTAVNADVGHVINKQYSVYTFTDGHRRTSDRVNKVFWPMADASTIMKYLPTKRLEVGLMAGLHVDRMEGNQTDVTMETDTIRSSSRLPGVWNNSVNATLYADWRLDSLGRMMNLNYNFFNSHDPLRSENESRTGSLVERLRSASHARYRIHALKLDFTLPFRSFILETGAAFTRITNKTGIDVETQDGAVWRKNVDESNDFNYRERGLAAYVSARTKLADRLQLQVGLRYEYTWTEGEQVTMRQTDRQHYGRFFPSFHLGWDGEAGRHVGLAVNWGIDRPNFNDLNPWRAYTTVHNYVTGNPHLTAAYTRNAELNYNNGQGLYLVLYNDHGSDELGYSVTFGSDGAQVGSPVNGVRHDKSGLYATYNRNLLSWLNVNAEGEAYYHDSRADHRSNLRPMYGWGKRVGATLGFLLNARKTMVASVAYSHAFSTYWSMNRTRPVDRLNLALNYACMDNRLKLRLACGDPFGWIVSRTEARYDGFVSRNRFDVHARYVAFRATWSFGGKRAKQIYHDNRDAETRRAPK